MPTIALSPPTNGRLVFVAFQPRQIKDIVDPCAPRHLIFGVFHVLLASGGVIQQINVQR
jgi:hypothetical protein